MGYDLHITRAEEWTESAANPITLDEWRSYLDADPEMQLDGFAEVKLTEGTLRYESEGLAVWIAYSGHDDAGGKAWFDFRDGMIVVKNPDEEIIRKMIQIADCLKANVQGDDFERYPRVPAQAQPKKRSFWQRLLGGGK